ncbi:NAD-dependent succinate-semialdehyde dehydrogenase [Aurantibacter crassamenti]|uniref:NAD-dependent succinate-semialdehyde dehydrogenase n=1 Tax=Aurantibacter crassamenti TaxID=1837375 RepID=UPI001EED3D98|nr:NAD-dependent succinate-semialdehyde dehydrogenase [Aurantibacter crassamenti]
MIKSINPYNGKLIKEYELHTPKEVSQKLKSASTSFEQWKLKPISERTKLLNTVGNQLKQNKNKYAALITNEMGKPIKQSIAEIEKCIWVCNFYAHNAEQFLADEIIETDAQESFISYDPIGCVLAIMPWNFPFWQVIRFAAPTVTAGNTIILKHAANVTGCALAIQELFELAGYPQGCFQSILVNHEQIETIIENDTIKAVTLTGSDAAGRKVAATAAKNLKKTVLELGGNNACIVWDDADLDKYINIMVNARMQNAGQSCIAAKRFIVMDKVYDAFLEKYTNSVTSLKSGNPENMDTDIATLARKDLAEKVKEQVEKTLQKGAKVHVGNSRDGAYYEPTIITDVKAGMPLFDEEVFGPVAAIIKVKTREESLKVASDSKFGLGTMLFTEDIDAARRSIGKISDGAFFINELVKSDPRLPFGGTKNSGYGRELSKEGILEFVNKKTVYIK